MKSMTVLISGAPEGQNLRDLEIEPGTSAGDVLRALNLQGYLLSREGSAQAFAVEESIFDAVQDGDKLRATPIAEVGAGLMDWLKTVLRHLGIGPKEPPPPPPAIPVQKAAATRPAVRSASRAASTVNRSPLKRVRVAPILAELVSANHTLRVQRDERPLWQLRGWRRSGHRLIGAYRTPRGSFAGEIHQKSRGHPRFFIVNPPAALLLGPHAACFRARGDGVYLVHFGIANPNVDAGIVGIEKLIALALLANGKR